MVDQEEDPEVLMHGHVMRKLRQDDLTAAEFEVCRKYLNDRAARGGNNYTKGFTVPSESQKSDWDGLGFDDVKIGGNGEGAGITYSGDSPPG